MLSCEDAVGLGVSIFQEQSLMPTHVTNSVSFAVHGAQSGFVAR